uniref:Replication protein A subunit n=1 Tax=Panagrellus redivivus TaxID=6233 RepID=A0A7E4VE63_PANRE
MENVQLTNGWIQEFLEGNPSTQTPTLQIAALRDTKQGPICYRARISDGTYTYATGGMSTDLKEQVEADGLLTDNKFAVIKVLGFKRGGSTETKIALIISEYELISLDYPLIGEPRPHNGDPSTYRGFKRQLQEDRNTTAGSYGNTGNPSTPSRRVPTSGNNANVMPIRALSPYISGKWRIYGNAVSKENLKEIQPRNGKGPMKVFSFILSDNQDDIKINCFGETAEKVAGIISEGRWFYVSDGANALRGANKRFNSTGHEYEITLNNNSTVELAEDQSQKAPKTTFKVVPLNQLSNCVAQSIDILAVIETVGDVTSLTTKDNRELKKRELTLIDQSSTSVQLTLWNENAETWTVEPSRVIGIKGAVVREFNGGFSLSIPGGSRLEIDPAGPATDELLKWYAAERPNADIKSVSSGAAGSGGNANSPAEIRVLSVVNNSPMVNSYDRGVYFNSICMIMSIRTENAVYAACPTDNCNKKVTGVDGGYRCEKCCKTTADCKYRYMVNLELSDGVSHAWATMFDDKAVALFGKSADEVAALKDANPEEYKRILTSPVFTTVNARLRGRTDVYNDVARVRFNLFEIKPVNHEAYSKCLDETIERLEAL